MRDSARETLRRFSLEALDANLRAVEKKTPARCRGGFGKSRAVLNPNSAGFTTEDTEVERIMIIGSWRVLCEIKHQTALYPVSIVS
jgi:hypothetical protein